MRTGTTSLLSAVSLAVVVILATIASATADVRQRTYSDCSPAIADTLGNVTVKCNGAEHRISIPSFEVCRRDVISFPFCGEIAFENFLYSNVGHIVFLNISFIGRDVLLDGNDLAGLADDDEFGRNFRVASYKKADLRLQYHNGGSVLFDLKDNRSEMIIILENYNEDEKDKDIPCDLEDLIHPKIDLMHLQMSAALHCKVTGFYIVSSVANNSAHLKHISYEKVLLNPKYDPP